MDDEPDSYSPVRLGRLQLLYRDGRVSVPLKGNLWKGPFHVPRMQLVCWKLLEEMVEVRRVQE